MKYYVIINGNSSLDIQGLAIESLPNISKPLIRTTREEIDGRDGDIITKLGYSAYDKTLNIGLWGNYDINEVITYFNEEGVITFSNEPDKYYKFHILNRIDFVNQLEKFKKASITIHCQPFKYKEQEAKVIEEEEHTTSGTSFNLSDTLEAPLEIDLKGNTSQTGTPTPDAPIDVNVVSGDNDIQVCNINYINIHTTPTASLVLPTISIDNDDYITYTNESGYRNVFFNTFIVEPNTAYYSYLDLKSGNTATPNVLVIEYDENMTQLRLIYPKNQTFQTQSNTRYIKYGLTTNGQNQTGTFTCRVMIRKGQSVPSTYEAYNGTTYNIDLPVENKFNIGTSTTTQLAITRTYSNSEITLDGTANGSSYLIDNNSVVATLPKGTYTMQVNVVSGTISNSNEAFVVKKIVGGTGTNLKQYSLYQTPSDKFQITLDETSDIALAYWVNSGVIYTNCKIQFQIEEGSKANTYTPYGTTPIELNKIGTYQDYIYKENDKWYKKPMVLKIASYNGETITTDYISTTGELTTGATIYYKNPIENPSGIEITYTPLIEQLNTLEEAQSKEGTTNINQVNNDLPFIIDLTYYTGDTSITITNDGNIYSKPLLELKGTGNINIYLNGIQVFVVSLNDEIIYIDTDKMEAYYQGTLKNRQVVGDYNNFKLQSGNNTIQVDGGYVEYLKITNYSRWV